MAKGTGELALQVESLSVDYGGFRAVDDVSLSVDDGERRAIIGPNGAGKTTLMNAISGALAPSEGEVRLFGETVTHVPEFERSRRGIARTFQITTLFPQLSVMDNLLMAALGKEKTKWVFHRRLARRFDIEERARLLLERVDLVDQRSRLVASLSHGEQRQLEMAVALTTQPRLLLLDEPAAGLSPAERQSMQELIAQIPRETTVVMIEHNMDVVLGMAETITVLHRGEIVAEGPPDEIQQDAQVRKVYLGGE